MAENRERLIYSIEVDQGQAIENAAKLEAELIKLRKERSELNKQARSEQGITAAQTKELARLNINIQKQSRALRVARKEAQAGNKTYAEQANRLSVLTDRWKKFQVGVNGTEDDLRTLGQAVKSLSDDLKDQDASIGNFQRNVGDYRNAITEALDGAGLGIGNITAALSNPVLLAGAIVSGIAEGTKALARFVDELGKQRAEVERLTGATGDALDRLTAKIQATSSTFGQEFNETLKSANTLSREFNVSLEEAADLQQQAFAAGADLNGNLADSIQEYSSQFRELGVSADEFLSIVTTSVTEGVFSDKGIDAIQEALLRVREMPQAAQDAIQAIGLSSTEISNSIVNGSKTVFEVVQDISARLSELPPESREVGQAIADIFGGAGETAGLRFLTTIQDIEGGLEGIIANSSEAAQRQLRLVEANERLDTAWNQLLGSSSDFFQEIKVGATEIFADFITRGLRGIENLVNGFIELYNNSLLFRGVLNTIGTAFRTAIDIVKAFFNINRVGFADLRRLVKAVVTGSFASIPDILSESRERFKGALKDAGADLAENFVEGFDNTLNPKLLESFSFGGDAALNEASKQSGKTLAGAFVDGYGEIVRTQIQGIAQEAQTLLNTQLAENDRLTELRDNVEGIRAEATVSEEDAAQARAITAEQEIAADQARIESVRSLASAVKQAAGERAEASKAAAVIEKLATATEIGVNLQREISAYWANTGTIPGVGPGIATALSIAAGIRAATALAQLAGFAEGGYTSGGGIPDPNLPGRTITGYVHDNEYVVPTHVMRSPQGFAHVKALEAMRAGLPGYASGGFTGTGIATQGAISRGELTGVIRTVMASMPPQYVAVTDINAGQRKVGIVQSRATI